jgi:hypothetical protein
MKRNFLVLAVFVFASLLTPDCTVAQEFRQLNGAQPIRVLESIETPFPFGHTNGRPQCDSEENVYLKPFREGEDMLKSNVVRIATKNRSITMFEPAKIPALAGSEVYSDAFALTPAGDLLVSVLFLKEKGAKEDKLFVVEFSPSAELRKLTTMSAFVKPSIMVRFPDGKLFLSGLLPFAPSDPNTPATRDAPPRSNSFSAIFTGDGQLLHNLTEPEDGFKTLPESEAGHSDLPQVGVVDARVGQDGQLYLLKEGNNPRVQVWTEEGEKKNEFPVIPPNPYWRPTELHLDNKHILVRFQEPIRKEKGLMVMPVEVSYDIQSGIALKHADLNMYQVMSVCQFKMHAIFMMNRNGHFTLVKALM